MKTVYIPKGEIVRYESLMTEHLVVHGCLQVSNGIKARTITGQGTISAGTIDADVIRVDDVEAPPPCGRASKVLLDTNFMPSLRERHRVLLPLRSLCGDRKADSDTQRDRRGEG